MTGAGYDPTGDDDLIGLSAEEVYARAVRDGVCSRDAELLEEWIEERGTVVYKPRSSLGIVGRGAAAFGEVLAERLRRADQNATVIPWRYVTDPEQPWLRLPKFAIFTGQPDVPVIPSKFRLYSHVCAVVIAARKVEAPVSFRIPFQLSGEDATRLRRFSAAIEVF